jgi:hypothetical protein
MSFEGHSNLLHLHGDSQLPSVVVLVAPMDISWSVLEWGGRETGIVEDVERLRSSLGPRDIRTLVVLVRRGPPVVDEREVEERVTGLRRRASLDNKAVYVLVDPQDLAPNAAAMRRLGRHVRELSSAYYLGSCKRVKRTETSLSRAYLPLMARYRVKQALWYEFLGSADKVLKHYRRAFDSLVELQMAHG